MGLVEKEWEIKRGFAKKIVDPGSESVTNVTDVDSAEEIVLGYDMIYSNNKLEESESEFLQERKLSTLFSLYENTVMDSADTLLNQY